MRSRFSRLVRTCIGARCMGTAVPHAPVLENHHGVPPGNDADARKARYVEALRTLIKGAPPTGCKVEEVAAGLHAILGEDADPTKFGFEKLSHALRGLQDHFYIANGNTLVPCDWQETMRRVRLTLPTEGVLLSTFLRHIRHQCPAFEEDSLPGHTVEAFVKDRFPFLFHVDHVCPGNGQPTVIRRQEVELTKKVLQMHRALTLLGRPSDVPVFTNAEALIPLLPNRSIEQSWPLQLLTRGDIADAFELDVDMLLRIPPVQRFEVMVDGATVSPIEVRRALLGVGVDVSLLAAAPPLRSSTNPDDAEEDLPTLSVTAVRHATDGCHSSTGSDVVVEAFMDVRDEIVAMIAARLSASGAGATSGSEAPTLVVVTGEGAGALAFEALLKETFSADALNALVLCTPMQQIALVGGA